MPGYRYQGPSPRARGAHPGQPQVQGDVGTIPACAGSTRQMAGAPRSPSDHPRVRGEHRGTQRGWCAPRGPSPRARGAPSARRRCGPRGGTIPACAGSTRRWGSTARRRWDHPRVRGEHARIPRMMSRLKGPSPRARGALVQVGVGLACGWTIPACAGSTEGDRKARVALEGPSPRARGAPPRAGPPSGPGGTIPACAGSTASCWSALRSWWDHPRVRGEHLAGLRGCKLETGPSPRARGAHPRGVFGCAAPGTIPACAGSTHRPRLGPHGRRDHPRVRGEHPAGRGPVA